MNFGTLKAKKDVTSTHAHAIEGAYAWMKHTLHQYCMQNLHGTFLFMLCLGLPCCSMGYLFL